MPGIALSALFILACIILTTTLPRSSLQDTVVLWLVAQATTWVCHPGPAAYQLCGLVLMLYNLSVFSLVEWVWWQDLPQRVAVRIDWVSVCVKNAQRRRPVNVLGLNDGPKTQWVTDWGGIWIQIYVLLRPACLPTMQGWRAEAQIQGNFHCRTGQGTATGLWV